MTSSSVTSVEGACSTAAYSIVCTNIVIFSQGNNRKSFFFQYCIIIIESVLIDKKTRFGSRVPVVRHLFLAITQKVLGAHQKFLQIFIPLVKSFHLSHVWALYAEVWWRIPISRVLFFYFTFSKLFLVKTQIFLQLMWYQCIGSIKCFHLRPFLLKSVK